MISRLPFLLFIFVALFSNFSEAQTKNEVTVLAVLPLTGDLAGIGEAVRNGMQIAESKSFSNDVHIIYEDDGGIPKNTVSIVRKYVSSSKHPNVVVTASSGTSKVVAPILEGEKIPLIAIATDETISRSKNWVVNFWVTPEVEIEKLIQEAQRREYKKIAIFSSIHDGTNSIKRKFEAANQGDLEIVFEDEFLLDQKDFKSNILKLKRVESSIDGVFVNVFFGQIGLFTKQLRDLGIEKPLFNVELFEDENELRVSQGAMVGAWYVQADEPSGWFLKEYKEKYPESSYFGAANGYDAVFMVASAPSDSAGINTFLHSVKDFQGALGVYSATKDNRYTLPATVKVVTREGFEVFSPELK